MEKLSSFQDIEIKLVGAIQNPYEVAVASARTCYSGKGVIFPEEVSKDEKAVSLREKIADSTLKAGHVTTRQHAHFVFSISGVSRMFIWSFLHGHPYYNSEQVSQRYVRVKSDNFVMPPLEGKAAEIFISTAHDQMKSYERLIDILRVPFTREYYERFPARKRHHEKWKTAIDKRCFEVARYVLGLGTTAYLYHTVSALTLLRYSKLVELFETPTEQKGVIKQMVAAVLAIDPLFEKELQDAIPLEKTLEYKMVRDSLHAPKVTKRFLDNFDTALGGRTSKLVSYSLNAESILADAIRASVGKNPNDLIDKHAIELLLDPKHNPILADTLNVSTLDRLSQLLHQVSFTFMKKISHAADSQDQRHRTVISSRPLLAAHYSGKPDFVTPFGITQSAEANDVYTASMGMTWTAINRLLDLGVKSEYAFYLLPNALSIRMTSTGDLAGLHHKWKMRSCYNAQEEIFRATLDEIRQVKDVFPGIGEHLLAPCYLRQRAGITPYCPEGDKYCGIPVWKLPIEKYERKSI